MYRSCLITTISSGVKGNYALTGIRDSLALCGRLQRQPLFAAAGLDLLGGSDKQDSLSLVACCCSSRCSCKSTCLLTFADLGLHNLPRYFDGMPCSMPASHLATTQCMGNHRPHPPPPDATSASLPRPDRTQSDVSAGGGSASKVEASLLERSRQHISYCGGLAHPSPTISYHHHPPSEKIGISIAWLTTKSPTSIPLLSVI